MVKISIIILNFIILLLLHSLLAVDFFVYILNNGIEFILFLILILLLTENDNEYRTYFNVFEKEINKIDQLINTISSK